MKRNKNLIEAFFGREIMTSVRGENEKNDFIRFLYKNLYNSFSIERSNNSK